jgi:hypothetical protein
MPQSSVNHLPFDERIKLLSFFLFLSYLIRFFLIALHISMLSCRHKKALQFYKINTEDARIFEYFE